MGVIRQIYEGSKLRFGTFTAVLCSLILPALPAWGQTDWPMFSHDYASTRYSPLKQINTQNVQHLAPAWTYRMKKDGPQSKSAGAVSRGGGIPPKPRPSW
jgi:hypothetical protein